MSVDAAFIPDQDDPGWAWLLVGEPGGTRHAQLRGPAESTPAELDVILSRIGWARTACWAITDEGWWVTPGVEVENETWAAAYRARVAS